MRDQRVETLRQALVRMELGFGEPENQQTSASLRPGLIRLLQTSRQKETHGRRGSPGKKHHHANESSRKEEGPVTPCPRRSHKIRQTLATAGLRDAVEALI